MVSTRKKSVLSLKVSISSKQVRFLTQLGYEGNISYISKVSIPRWESEQAFKPVISIERLAQSEQNTYFPTLE